MPPVMPPVIPADTPTRRMGGGRVLALAGGALVIGMGALVVQAMLRAPARDARRAEWAAFNARVLDVPRTRAWALAAGNEYARLDQALATASSEGRAADVRLDRERLDLAVAGAVYSQPALAADSVWRQRLVLVETRIPDSDPFTAASLALAARDGYRAYAQTLVTTDPARAQAWTERAQRAERSWLRADSAVAAAAGAASRTPSRRPSS